MGGRLRAALDGRLVQSPYHYRDARTGSGVAEVHRRIPAEELYARTALQHLPFNTLFQLTVDRLTGALDGADTALLIPDLVAYWLTGAAVTERTNASTTGAAQSDNGRWCPSLRPTRTLSTRWFA